MRRYGFFSFLATLLLIGIAGVVAYNWGFSNGLAQSVANGGGTVVYGPGYGWGGGFSFFGLIFGLFILFLIFGAIRAIAFGGRGGRHGYWHGGYGPGGFGYYGRGPAGPGRSEPGSTDANQSRGDAGVPPWAEGMLQAWHRNAHGDEASGPAGQGSPSPTAPPPGSSPVR